MAWFSTSSAALAQPLLQPTRRVAGHISARLILRATVRSIAVGAAKGQTSAQKLFLDLVNKTETARRQAYERTAEEFAIYQLEWEEVFKEYKAKGLPPPNQAPHPHGLQFDAATGKITVIGPQNESEKLKWEKLSDSPQSLEDSNAELQIIRQDPENCDTRYLIDEDIAFNTSICCRLRAALQGWRKRT